MKFLEAFIAVVVACAMIAFAGFVIALTCLRVCIVPIIAICLIILTFCAVYSLVW